MRLAVSAFARQNADERAILLAAASPLCTNPCTVFTNASPNEVDFISAPTFGGANPPDATYHA